MPPSRERKVSGASRPQARAAPAHLEDCWDEPDPALQHVRTDLKELQGAWVSTSGRRKVEFLVSGSHVTVHFADGAIYMGAFSLGPFEHPHAMDVRIEEGPAQHKGQVALCIYELSGDTLRWCTAGPGQPQRPTAFPAEDDPHYLCLLFRREGANGLA